MFEGGAMGTFSVVMIRKPIGRFKFSTHLFIFFAFMICRTDTCAHEQVDVPLYTNYLGKRYFHYYLNILFKMIL